jgi:hypothetical protein
MYFANPTGAAVAEMIAGRLGYIDTPLQGNKRPAGVVWCADNGCFNDEKFNEAQWWRWLENNAHDAPACIFATAPDVYADAAATIERSRRWLPRIRTLGYPAAFVAQDGQENLAVPWDELDVLFIGGRKTENPKHEWKRGPHAWRLAMDAKALGKWVHVGRVNSGKTYRYFSGIADSCDGTFLTRAPDKNLTRMQRWFSDFEQRPPLFDFREPA